MAVSAFALIGLKIIRTRYAADGNQHFLPSIILPIPRLRRTIGLDSRDRQIIRQQKSVKQVDFGYLQDSTIDQTKQALRIFFTNQWRLKLADGQWTSTAA